MKTVYNKNVMIIGAETAIGQAIALEFSKEKANIIAIGSDKEKLGDIERTIGNRRSKIRSYRCDLTLHKETERVLDDILKYHDQIDMLIFANGFESSKLFSQADPDEIVSILNQSFISTVWFTKLIFSHMMERKRGEIVYIPQFHPGQASDGIIEGLCLGGSFAFFEGLRGFFKTINADIPVVIAHYAGKEIDETKSAISIVQAVMKGKTSVRI
ncbi:MAG TPA: SDR family NAD(P)-dependent oxidoreductase [Spirochaetota bacterium]